MWFTAQPVAPPPPAEKPPVPPEHQLLVAAFNGLLSHCRARANNAVSWTDTHTSTQHTHTHRWQTAPFSTQVVKRKVEDISHKLELLYDLLRDGSLSHEILHGLHYIAQGELSSSHPLLLSNSLLFLVSFISVLTSPHPLFLLSPLLIHRHSGHELLWCIDEVESNGVLKQPVRD